MRRDADARGPVATREAFAASDRGRIRRVNEDAVVACPELGLYLVADGLGGHAAGEVASAIACGVIRDVYRARTDLRPVARVRRAIAEANDRIRDHGQAHGACRGMGSTVVALFEHAARAGVAHVGDSRCYVSRAGVLLRLTRDHSLREELLALNARLAVDAGKYGNVLTRTLGEASGGEPDVRVFEARPSDLFLLCSDGLSSVVDDARIEAIVRSGGSLADRCDRLIEAANRAGGPDNVSVILVGPARRGSDPHGGS